MKNCKRVIAITEYVKDDIIRLLHVKPEKIAVVYDCVPHPCNFESKPIEALKGKKFILSVNSIDRFKNTATLIKAFRKLNEKDYFLVLVGKETDYWKNVCIPLVNENVIHLQYVSDDELDWLYKHAKLFVTSSLREGFGLTPVEAAVRDCPVISSRSEALPEATMESVFYYEPATDDEALLSAIEKVLDKIAHDEDFDDELHRIGEQFRKRYDIQRFPKEIIKEIINACN